ncbi:MAG: hypothetical protein J6J03_04550, partial [Tyzzerella sp.]|nr:hypothetical protein [Tyzzerella sp.]
MKKMRQRWIAILCCVAMLVTGLYVTEPQKAEAASSGTLSITSTEKGFILTTTNPLIGYINVDFSATVTVANGDYNIFTEDFIDEYMIFEGGMTKEDFKEGFERAYLATSSILQIRWPDRTRAFEAGWSFSIVEGAPIYYNGGASYVTLDKEYTFLFQEGNA